MLNESRITRGSGWQKIGAITNLVAYYAVGIPVALLFGFGLNFNGKGLWIGILTGSTLQTITLALLTAFTNWEKQVLNSVLYLLLFYAMSSSKSANHNKN